MANRRKFLFDHDQLISFAKFQTKNTELEKRWSRLVERYEEGITVADESFTAEFFKIAPPKFEVR